MLDRRVATYAQAVAGIKDGATLLINGFGGSGVPLGLIAAIMAAGLRDLTVVANNAGAAANDIAWLVREGRLRKIVSSYPRSPTSTAFDEAYAAGRIELELVPQGTFVERIRCGGAGLGGFFTPVGAGTRLAEGKETRMIDGREHVFEKPIRGDATLLKACKADRLGNLTYRRLARNMGPAMATASHLVIAEVDEIVGVGEIEPEAVVTPSIFVDRIVQRGAPT